MKLAFIATVLSASAALTFAQDHRPALGESAGTVPVKMIVTVESLRGAEIPPIAREQVAAFRDPDTKLPVTGWIPLGGKNAGENASLDLYIFIDEGASPNLGNQLDEVRRFVSLLPESASVGVAYMRNGSIDLAQFPVKDHARAVQAIRMPAGTASAMANPYHSLSDLINCGTKCWQPESLREVVMITDGIDRFESIGYDNVYVTTAIADAQRNGVIVYSMYAAGSGHSSHSPALIHWGQLYLAQVAEETGGEAFAEPAGSFQPYLTDLSAHLANQYLVTFLAKPAKEFQPIRFAVRTPDVELVAAHGFYLKAIPSED